MSEREKLAESTRESCSSKSVETDRKKAEEKRCQALERIGETKRRANEEWKDIEKAAKKRSWCYRISMEKSEKELKIRQEELALKAGEVENEKEKQARC